MEVLLRNDVEALGKAGEVVRVRAGYARNFLFPRKFALPVTGDNLKRVEGEKHKRAKVEASRLSEMKALAKKLDMASITIETRATPEGKLYGSVGPAEIVAALGREGYSVPESAVVLAPVRDLGVFEVALRLHPDVKSTLRLWIVEKKGER
ncbi:MAG: 50S ribosomal protein L9 [Planctomycetales bacterium]|nr:50S ribosomal protein L9 [Planctomycetales bacterium]